MKKRILFLLIYFSYILFGQSILVKADLGRNQPYVCNGRLKSFVASYPLKIKLENERLSWEIDWDHPWYDFGLAGDYYKRRDNIEFDVKYSDGVFVTRIDDNKLSIKILNIDGTLLIDRCQLEMPIELEMFKLHKLMQ
tara:strand:- start:290 stop:703 length:414 start_codon:yes stop_codon:yes gene_type:complete